MSVYAHVDGLGVVLEQLVADSVLAWRREFRPGNKTVDTFAEHLYEVSTTCSVRPAGVAICTVTVKGRGFNDTSVECFRLKRKRGGEWKLGASSLDRK